MKDKAEDLAKNLKAASKRIQRNTILKVQDESRKFIHNTMAYAVKQLQREMIVLME